MRTENQSKKVEYKLCYTYKGKEYCNSESRPVISSEAQYEAVALGLLLGDIDCHHFDRNDSYQKLCLIEIDDNNSKCVWSEDSYCPSSVHID